MTVDPAISRAFSRFPALTTPRLRLRQLLPADAEALFAIKSDPEVTSHYGQEPHQSPADTLTWIQRRMADFDQRDSIAWGITLKFDNRVIGALTLWNFDPTYHAAELGYELHPAYQHQGIMAEAINAVLAFGFNEMNLHRVEACPLAANPPSRAILEKLGFAYEGTLRQRIFFRGRFEDQMYYGLLKEEWEASR